MMTREEAIKQIEKLKSYCEYMADSDESGAYLDEWLGSVGTVMVGKGLSSYGELIGCIEDAPTLTQPNEPLTEEQLEKMIGEPIWVESARRKEWMLLWGYHGPEVYGRAFIFTRRTAQKEQFPFSELRVTWWPYRRPPEGEK